VANWPPWRGGIWGILGGIKDLERELEMETKGEYGELRKEIMILEKITVCELKREMKGEIAAIHHEPKPPKKEMLSSMTIQSHPSYDHARSGVHHEGP